MTNIIIRPKCKCHDIEMKKNGFRNGIQQWECSIRRREISIRSARKRGVREQKEYFESIKNHYYKDGKPYCKCHDVEAYIVPKTKYVQCRIKKKQAKRKWTEKNPEKIKIGLQKLYQYHEEKMEKDLIYRLKRDTKRWQQNRKRGTYI